MPSCPLSPTPGPIKSANNSCRECYASLSSRSFPTGATVPLLQEKSGPAPVPIRNEKSLPNVELLKNAQSSRKETLSGIWLSCWRVDVGFLAVSRLPVLTLIRFTLAMHGARHPPTDGPF